MCSTPNPDPDQSFSTRLSSAFTDFQDKWLHLHQHSCQGRNGDRHHSQEATAGRSISYLGNTGHPGPDKMLPELMGGVFCSHLSRMVQPFWDSALCPPTWLSGAQEDVKCQDCRRVKAIGHKDQFLSLVTPLFYSTHLNPTRACGKNFEILKLTTSLISYWDKICFILPTRQLDS